MPTAHKTIYITNNELRFPLPMLISGGQTGVDQTALEAAFALGIPHGGWCPKGRRCEKGKIPDRFHLSETTTAQYPARTRMNVRDSDATLIFSDGCLSKGTSLTHRFARDLGRPSLFIRANSMAIADISGCLGQWLSEIRPLILNVAGPRKSESPGLADLVFQILTQSLKASHEKVVWPPSRSAK